VNYKKNTSSLKNKTAINRPCSVCQKIGHIKTDCPVAEARAIRATHVPVHFSRKPRQSAHVVTLSQKKSINSPLNFPIFSEITPEQPKRVVIDFASLVKKANRNEAEPNQDIDSESSDIVSKKSFLKRIAASYIEFCARLELRFFVWTAFALVVLLLVPYPAFSYYQKLRHDSNYLVSESVNAFLSLQSSTAAALATNLPQAQLDLNVALNSFGNVEAMIEKEHRALIYIASILPVVGEKVVSRQHILAAGHMVALGNTYLVKGIGEAAASSSKADFLERMNILKIHIRGAVPQYQNALMELAQVKSQTLPVEYQNSFADFKVLFAGLIGDLQKMTSVITGLETVLGSDSPRRYLLVFQNHHELRPTGGFIGSMAILDVQRGKIMNLEVPPGGSYDLQGQLDTFVKPPLPLQIANPRWEFQDANWFPDFPASAQKIAWFYKHSRDSTVDGVIAVNASVLERILKVIGPLQNDHYQLQLTAADALEKLQTEVETGEDKALNRPKAIIGDVFHQLINNAGVINSGQIISLVSELGTALTQKEIQIYTVDSAAQKKFSELGWTGEITATLPTQDYLMVVNTNLGGAKSDARITDEIEHQAVVQPDRSIVDTVIIRRKHSGNPSDALYGRPNNSYVRVYVPEGAEIINASGFVYPEEESFKVPEKWYTDDEDLKTHETERGFHVGSGTRITNEFNKTVFGNWITTKAGEDTEVWFTYKLPFFVTAPPSRYSLLVQKQSGTNSNFSTQIIYPDGWSPIWRNRDDAEIGTNGLRWADTLTTDELFGVVMSQNSIY